jgi:hypothetical protein
MTIRMRVMPRFPAKITATNGLVVERPNGTPNLVIKPSFGDLVQIPNVGDGDNVFFMAWDKLLGLYRIMSFNDLFAGIADLGFMTADIYDPQGKLADAFDRDNHTGVQAISTISGLQTELNTKVSLVGVETLTNKTLTAPVLNAPVINSPTGELLRGHIWGLSFSNDTGGDVTNDFITSVGAAASDDATPVLMTLPSAMTKRTDAAWAAGSGNGGWLDGASMPNGTGHTFLMRNPTSGAVDIGLSASLTPTLPSGYTQKRRIHSAVLRESAALVLVKQNGNDFTRASVSDLTTTSAAAIALLNLSVPVGIIVQPKISTVLILNQSTTAQIFVGNAFDGGSNMMELQNARTVSGGIASDAAMITSGIYTNTSGQIYLGRSVPAGSINLFRLATVGWIDERGQ